MSKKKKGFLKRARNNTEMELPITAMADIFTVILVFLLKSYATSAVNITPSKGMMMPSAYADEANLEAIRVEVTEAAVAIEGEPVAQLTGFQATAGDKQKNGTMKSLENAFEKARKRQLLIAQANADVKVDAKILVVADRRTPYSTLKSVLASAAVHGYTDFKLAVVRGE